MIPEHLEDSPLRFHGDWCHHCSWRLRPGRRVGGAWTIQGRPSLTESQSDRCSHPSDSVRDRIPGTASGTYVRGTPNSKVSLRLRGGEGPGPAPPGRRLGERPKSLGVWQTWETLAPSRGRKCHSFHVFFPLRITAHSGGMSLTGFPGLGQCILAESESSLCLC